MPNWGPPKSHGGQRIVEMESQYGPGNPPDLVWEGKVLKYLVMCFVTKGICILIEC